MKLAKVEHIRCGDYSGASFLWVPDELTAKSFSEAILRAEAKYLDNYKEYSGYTDFPHYGPTLNKQYFEKYPNETVSNIISIFEEETVKWSVKEKRRRELTKSFMDILVEEIPGSCKFYYLDFEEEGLLTEEVDWGHRHGMSIDYGETSIYSGPPGPGDLRDDFE